MMVGRVTPMRSARSACVIPPRANRRDRIPFRGLIRDRRVPRSSKLWLWFAVAWLVSPIDLIPSSSPWPDRSTTRSWPRSCCATF
ncbi:MAG: YkvA family protein [Actinomycetota bacterium]